MARRVFFSFHFEKDVFRVNHVRNSWVTQGKEVAGYIDKAEFEKIKLGGERAIKNWIDNQLYGTSVTVVLIGEETLGRDWVQYEIMESKKRGNGIIGVRIHNEKSIDGTTSRPGNTTKIIGLENRKYIWFNDIVDGIYDYTKDYGYKNLGYWIEESARKHNK